MAPLLLKIARFFEGTAPRRQVARLMAAAAAPVDGAARATAVVAGMTQDPAENGGATLAPAREAGCFPRPPMVRHQGQIKSLLRSKVVHATFVEHDPPNSLQPCQGCCRCRLRPSRCERQSWLRQAPSQSGTGALVGCGH